MAGLKLDRLTAFINITQVSRVPTTAFIQLWEKLCKKLETQESRQDTQIALLQANQAAQQALLESINSLQDQIDAGGGSGTAISGNNTATGLVISGTSWVEGPVVTLSGVVAGALTVPGSGPIGSGATGEGFTGTFSGKIRLVEVVTGVDTVLIDTWDFSAINDGGVIILTNDSTAAIAAYSSSRTATGTLDYRMDFRGTGSTGSVTFDAYLYARRA